jgi:hypothetical protein
MTETVANDEQALAILRAVRPGPAAGLARIESVMAAIPAS